MAAGWKNMVDGGTSRAEEGIKMAEEWAKMADDRINTACDGTNMEEIEISMADERINMDCDAINMADDALCKQTDDLMFTAPTSPISYMPSPCCKRPQCVVIRVN